MNNYKGENCDWNASGYCYRKKSIYKDGCCGEESCIYVNLEHLERWKKELKRKQEDITKHPDYIDPYLRGGENQNYN